MKAFRTCLSAAFRPYPLPPWVCGKTGRNDTAKHVTAEPRAAGEPVVLEPGLVVMRQAVNRQQQVALAAEAWAAGAGERNPRHSFFEADGSLRGPKGGRGRIFDACAKFDDGLTRLLLPSCVDWVRLARSVDPSMPDHNATHLLLLYYRDGGTLGFHRDTQANDGTGDEPIVNLTLGGEMDFAVRHEHSDVARVLTLRSGDVILFGGPCRHILHAVLETRGVRDDVLPEAASGGRLSFTLRHAPEVLAQEHLYAHFRPQHSDPGHQPTGDEMLFGRAEAQRRLEKMVG